MSEPNTDPDVEAEPAEAPAAALPPEVVAALNERPAELAAFVEHIEEINDLLDLLALGGSAMDDEMVVLLAETANKAGTLADTATEPETVRGLESMLHAVGDATGDLEEPPERVGMVGLLRAMRDPEVQAGMGFLLAIARGIGADLTRRTEMRKP